MTIRYLAVLLIAACFNTAIAADFVPKKRVELVVHTGPGGGADIAARALNAMIEQEKMLPLGTEVVNKPGPTGASAMGYLAQKAGDPHILAVFSSTYLVDPIVNPDAPITWKQTTPIAILLLEPGIGLVKADSPYKTFNDFIADAKARPGQPIQAGGALGVNTISRMLIEKKSGASWKFVPFPTGGERVASLLGGHSHLLFLEAQQAISYIQAGTMRGLVMDNADERLAAFPDVPTMNEVGYGEADQVRSNRGILAPPGLPKEAIDFWDGFFAKLVKTAAWKTYVEKNFIQTAFMPSAPTAKYLQEYTENVRSVLKENGFKVTDK